MELKETKVSEKHIYTGPVFTVTSDVVRLPDGKESGRDLVHSNGGVVILPVDEDGSVTLVRQYRHAHKRVLLEAVAGKLEDGEEPFAAAQRELEEESGFRAKEWIYLGAIATSPGFLTEQLYLYMARGLTAGAQHLDEGEFLENVRMPLAEAAERAADGRIDDGKTAVILLRAAARLAKEN